MVTCWENWELSPRIVGQTYTFSQNRKGYSSYGMVKLCTIDNTINKSTNLNYVVKFISYGMINVMLLSAKLSRFIKCVSHS